MRRLIIFTLFISSIASASEKRMALIKNGVITNIAIWDGVAVWHPSDVTLIEVTNQPHVDIGATCVKCDGSDFAAPPQAQ